MDWECPNCLYIARILHHNPRPPDSGPSCPDCDCEMQSLNIAPLPVLNLDEIVDDIFADVDTEMLPAR